MAGAYIVAAARTAGAEKGGKLMGWHPVGLAARVLNSLFDCAGIADHVRRRRHGQRDALGPFRA